MDSCARWCGSLDAALARFAANRSAAQPQSSALTFSSSADADSVSEAAQPQSIPEADASNLPDRAAVATHPPRVQSKFKGRAAAAKPPAGHGAKPKGQEYAAGTAKIPIMSSEVKVRAPAPCMHEIALFKAAQGAQDMHKSGILCGCLT